jgi:hypothetical protein
MHSCVLIIGDNPEQQLVPFDQEKRTKFNDLTDEYKKEYKGKDSNGKTYKEIYITFGEFATDWHGAEHNGGTADTAIWYDVDMDKLEPTAAVLFDGRWYDIDDDWHSTNEVQQSKEWCKRFRNIIKQIAPNAPLAIYDLHI